jgi:predicted nucleic acid-binding protein
LIIYLDTSALVKLFLDEQHSDAVRQWADDSAKVMVSQLSWTETCAALALKKRTGQISAAQVDATLAALHQDWPRYQRLATDAALFSEAGALALRLNLRAYDSVQLASARRVFAVTGAALTFCSFDRKLNSAAQALGMPVITAG